MIDGREKRKCQLVFELQTSRGYEKCSNALTHTKTINFHFSQLLSGAYNHELCLIIIQV